jgi:hypothetical protein
MKSPPNRHRQAHPDFVDELGPISDETAAVIAQLLSDLHRQFEERFFGQIRRHHDAVRSPPKYPDQPWLTTRSQSDESF